MGSEIKCLDKRGIVGKVLGTAELQKIEVIRNNKLLKRYDMELLGQQKSEFNFINN